ncbi:MAG TPA: alpha/beta fold hydrolase [Steroidobacteraceae bacterium]|jgi:pimeloyl-ACP methyl ester carboxylesterase|nr:alpha/beta fold hydrolase [Steroidobacteraceae bacterium]
MKQPLLLLSGLLCDETVWADLPERLADVADVRILSFSGFSSIAAMAEHVLTVAPERFALAGHSMGGRVALEVVRAARSRIVGLALLNTGVHTVRDGEPQSRGRLLRLAYEKGMSALAAEWLPPMMAGGARSAELMPRLTAMIERSTPDVYAGQVNALLNRPDALPVLPTIAVPTLLLSGSEDTWSPVSQHETMRRRIPHATLFEIHGAGHMAPFERPDAVAVALREWLAKIRSPMLR